MSDKSASDKAKTIRFGRETLAWLLAAGLIGLLVVIGLYKHETIPYMITKEGKLSEMGTDYRFTVVVEGETGQADQILSDARTEAMQIGTEMSTHLEYSPLNQLNRAAEAEQIPLPPKTLEVLQAARGFHEKTAKAFDVTIFPVIQLYRKAAETGRTPSPEQIARARDASNWQDFQILPDGTVIKLRSTAGVDLGGLAKGYAIDRAIGIMQSGNVVGGLAEIGGDLRTFGSPPGGRRWRIAVKNPFRPENEEKPFCVLTIGDAAVCTSGNYRRAYELDGVRYSHIIDPRDPRRRKAAEFPASVTVVAPTAIQADAWATALSVVGYEEGMALLDKAEGVEAMFVEGTAEQPRTLMTPGFGALIDPETMPPGVEDPLAVSALARSAD